MAGQDISHAWQDAISDRHASLQVRLQDAQKEMSDKRTELLACHREWELESEALGGLENHLAWQERLARQDADTAATAQAHLAQYKKEHDELKRKITTGNPFGWIPGTNEALTKLSDLITSAEHDEEELTRVAKSTQSEADAGQRMVDASKSVVESKRQSVNNKRGRMIDLRTAEKNLTFSISSLKRTMTALMKPSVSGK